MDSRFMKKSKNVGRKRKKERMKEKETHPIVDYCFPCDFKITENWWYELRGNITGLDCKHD